MRFGAASPFALAPAGVSPALSIRSDTVSPPLRISAPNRFRVASACRARAASRIFAVRRRTAAALCEAFLRFLVQETTAPVMLAAMETSRRHRLSSWDAAILEAARALGCELVLSEDLAHGRSYDGLRVENPFGARP